MKRKVSLVLFSLLCITQLTFAKHDKKLLKKNNVVEQFALNNDVNSAQSVKGFQCVDSNCPIDCKRGKKGKTGHRGPRGIDGDPGLGELFINALMMAWFSEGVFPPSATFDPYLIGTRMQAWSLSTGDPAIGMSFDIPVDLDRTKPVTVVVHLLVDSSLPFLGGDQAKIQINIDYQPDGGIVGDTPPGTDFADVQVSPDFTVTPAMPLSSTNLRQQSVAISLDPTKIDGDWAFIALQRIAPAANEFTAPIYLSTVSLQYSRLLP